MRLRYDNMFNSFFILLYLILILVFIIYICPVSFTGLFFKTKIQNFDFKYPVFFFRVAPLHGSDLY